MKQKDSIGVASRKTLLVRIAKWALMAGTAVVLLLVFAVFFAPIKNTRVTRLKSGRQITVVSNSMFVEMGCDQNSAKIETQGKVIVVQPDSIQVNDQEKKYIDPELKDVKIDCRNGLVEVTGQNLRLTIQPDR